MPARDFSIAIIGGGFGGIAAAYYLKQQGITNFTIFESSDGPGGTWRDNRYPGAACDVESHSYSFSFALKPDWTRVHAMQPEILAYIEDTVDRFELRPHFRFGTRVIELRWHDAQQVWELRTQTGEMRCFNLVISCVGLLNVPNEPRFPGLEKFQGLAFHSAHWPEKLDIRGKRVAVVGAGSSAAQIVPALAPEVEHLYVYQREPGWVIPNPSGDAPLDAKKINAFRKSKLRMRLERYGLFWRRELGAAAMKVGSHTHRKRTLAAQRWLAQSVHDPLVRQALTPEYPFFCKRPTRDPGFLPAFNRPNVTLVPHAVTGFTANGIRSADSLEREIDLAVLAIGFKATDFLSTFKVIGRNGKELHDEWNEIGGPEAFLGLTVSGFPNFFMLYGPNTNVLNSIIFILETQAVYITDVVRHMLRKGLCEVEVKHSAQVRFNDWLKRQMPKTAFLTGCNNYYINQHGKVVTNWPFSSVRYWITTKLLGIRTPGIFLKRAAHLRSGNDRRRTNELAREDLTKA